MNRRKWIIVFAVCGAMIAVFLAGTITLIEVIGGYKVENFGNCKMEREIIDPYEIARLKAAGSAGFNAMVRCGPEGHDMHLALVFIVDGYSGDVAAGQDLSCVHTVVRGPYTRILYHEGEDLICEALP